MNITPELAADLETLKSLVILRSQLESKISDTFPEIRQQIADLQIQLDAATVDERAELLAATQYEEQVREKITAQIDAMWQERWAALGQGQQVDPLEFPEWLTVMRVQTVEITHENLVPAEFKTVDLKKIKASGLDVPGSRVTVKPAIKVLKGKIK
jgi:hypothetical protein